MYVCVCACVYMCCLCACLPFFEHANSAKNKEQLSGSFVFGPLKLLTKVKQFGSSLEEVGRKVPSAVLPRVDFKVNFQLLKVSLTSHKITLIYAIF